MNIAPASTEAATFLTISVSLLIFNIGLPGLVIQIATPEGFRPLVRKYQIGVFRRMLPVILYLLLLCTAFTWWLFPNSPLISPPVWDGDFATYMVILALGLSIFTWFVYFRDSMAEHIVKLLRARLKRKLKKQHSISPSHLKDLLFIGEYCETSGEKAAVIRVLTELISIIQDRSIPHHGKVYADELLRTAERIVTNPAKQGSDENYLALLQLAAKIVDGAPEPDRATQKMVRVAWELVQRLGIEAVRTQSRTVCHQFLKVSAKNAPILLEIGVAALAHGRFALVREALHKLELIAEKAELGMNSETHSLLSFLALLSGTGSTSMSALAMSYLELRRNVFVPSRRECLVFALKNEARFDTKDALSQLYRMLYGVAPSV